MSGNIKYFSAVIGAIVGLAVLQPESLHGQVPQDGATQTKPTTLPSSRPASRPVWKSSLSLPVDLWSDVTAQTIGETGDWTNKVEIADIDNDGRPDILFANGGDYDRPGTPVQSRVFLNRGADVPFADGTKATFGDATFFCRVIKVRDVDHDGFADIMVGTTFQTQSRLFRGLGDGRFVDATADHLPGRLAGVGDLEFGDVDGDGDLDLALADWGPDSPMRNAGGRTMLWLNYGAGRFTDVTAEQMPDVAVRFCWELEFVDVDDDFDLDLLISSKRSKGSFLFTNDGTGRFSDVTDGRLPQFTNNYEFEAMDLDGDRCLDLVTINDGRFREHAFRGDGKGGYIDATEALWPPSENPSYDDNMVAFLDFDSDGDADFLIGSLDGPDRLLVNDGAGRLAAAAPVFFGDPTNGTLGIAIADLNGDGRIDVVHAQGEVKTASAEKVFFGKSIAKDTAPPTISHVEVPTETTAETPFVVRARIHDRKSPTMPHDWSRVVLRWTQDGVAVVTPFRWYGEYLWRATVPAPRRGAGTVTIEAVDAAGNRAVSEPRSVTVR